MASTHLYQILVQPNVNRTLDNPGVRVFEMNLTPEQLAGIVLMARALFPGAAFRHIGVYNLQGLTSQLPPQLQVTQLIYEPFTERLNQYLGQGIPWRLAIRLTFPQSAPITRRYTALLASLDGAITQYVQFDTPEFLQGAISVLKWFDIEPWDDQIMDLHENDTRIEIANHDDYD